jgi:hypothetical protein
MKRIKTLLKKELLINIKNEDDLLILSNDTNVAIELGIIGLFPNSILIQRQLLPFHIGKSSKRIVDGFLVLNKDLNITAISTSKSIEIQKHKRSYNNELVQLLIETKNISIDPLINHYLPRIVKITSDRYPRSTFRAHTLPLRDYKPLKKHKFYSIHRVNKRFLRTFSWHYDADEDNRVRYIYLGTPIEAHDLYTHEVIGTLLLISSIVTIYKHNFRRNLSKIEWDLLFSNLGLSLLPSTKITTLDNAFTTLFSHFLAEPERDEINIDPNDIIL